MQILSNVNSPPPGLLDLSHLHFAVGESVPLHLVSQPVRHVHIAISPRHMGPAGQVLEVGARRIVGRDLQKLLFNIFGICICICICICIGNGLAIVALGMTHDISESEVVGTVVVQATVGHGGCRY